MTPPVASAVLTKTVHGSGSEIDIEGFCIAVTYVPGVTGCSWFTTTGSVPTIAPGDMSVGVGSLGWVTGPGSVSAGVGWPAVAPGVDVLVAGSGDPDVQAARITVSMVS